jgi:hypothetical protein
VPPPGFRYYDLYKRQMGEPERRIETTLTTYIKSSDFERRYPKAHAKWREADGTLWHEKSESHLSTIGHLCREAVQEFATVLVETHRPPDADPNPAHEIKRVGAVLTHLCRESDTTMRKLIGAALDYWEQVSGLVQRVEHAGQREKEALRWDDARAVVFQTGFLMYEIDRLVSRSRSDV